MRFLLVLLPFVLFAEVIKPIEKLPYNKQKASLGKKLFFDPILSKDNKISCASCHKPNEGWSDNRKFPIGVFGRIDNVHSMSVLNAVYNFRLNWNGEFIDLKSQADGAITNSIEMGMTKEEVEKKINHSSYKKEFKKIYKKDKVSYDDVLEVIAEFEKSLVTPNSKFDLYLKGKINLSKKEMNGYLLFKRYGCIMCHNGINVGGNSFQKMGTIINYKNCDNDRYSITKNLADKCIYRVASLRNVTLRKSFFHDGSARSLYEAVEKMAYYNLGYYLKDKEIKDIIEFLKTLTGKLNEK